MSTITVFGISNCDQVRKGRDWLAEQGVEFTFHDFRKDGLSTTDVGQWVAAMGWENVINKRSKVWRDLSPEERDSMGEQEAIAVAVAQPTFIKRPFLVAGNQHVPGFDAQRWQEALDSLTK